MTRFSEPMIRLLVPLPEFLQDSLLCALCGSKFISTGSQKLEASSQELIAQLRSANSNLRSANLMLRLAKSTLRSAKMVLRLAKKPFRWWRKFPYPRFPTNIHINGLSEIHAGQNHPR